MKKMIVNITEIDILVKDTAESKWWGKMVVNRKNRSVLPHVKEVRLTHLHSRKNDKEGWV
jgi:hypothetical protein